MIADVPAGLPTFAWPGVGLGEVGALSGGALALALVALAESIGAARSLAAKGGYEIDPNQELIALGASNIGAGLLQGFPVDASLSRSAVGEAAGVRSRVSGLAVAALLVATMLFLTPLFDGLPQATLAAIIIAAVIRLVDLNGFRELWQIDHGDAKLAVVGFAAVALLGVLPGIVIAVLASLLALIRRVYRPRVTILGRATGEASTDEDYRFRSVDRHPEYETIPGPRALSLLERVVLRERIVLSRRDAHARRHGPIRRREPSSSIARRSATSTRRGRRCSKSSSRGSGRTASRSSSRGSRTSWATPSGG